MQRPPCACAFLLAILLASTAAFGDIELPPADIEAPIVLRADEAVRWKRGAYDVWHLKGHCDIRQGGRVTQAREAVLWIDPSPDPSRRPHKIIAYLEGDVRIDHRRAGPPHAATGRSSENLAAESWFGRLNTSARIDTRIGRTEWQPRETPAVYERAMEAWSPGPPADARPAKFSQEEIAPGRAGELVVQGGRRVSVTPRDGGRIQFEVSPDPQRAEQVTAIHSPVRVVVEGIDQFELLRGTIDIESDRMVIWSGAGGLDLSGQSVDSGREPLEFYLEGNIVFRQGDRVIYADRMYYNVTGEYGTIVNTEILTPVPGYQGLLRLKGDVVRQLDRENFVAQGGALTSSRLGLPRYWMQAEEITFQDRQLPLTNFFTGEPAIDPATGEQAVQHQMLATSRNNFVYAGGIPVFYWPVLATDLNQSNYFIEDFAIKNDNIFGTQILADFNAYHLFGIGAPPTGTEWTLSADYFSERGPAVGTYFRYDRESLFGVPGRNYGFIDFWGIRDTGLDTLGADRLALNPERTYRGRLLARHRHEFQSGLRLTGEAGLISDRNFLEQYFEREWDQLKDQTTGVIFERPLDNYSLSLSADVRINDFFTQTEWLPRADHFLIGQPLLNDLLTWQGHTHAGYAQLRAAGPPVDPVDAAKFNPLPWEANVEGLRAGTRQEIDLPLDAGPGRIVPYALGDVTFYGSDLTGENVTRLFGQIGVRSSISAWKANPEVQSALFNLNGLAHKVTLEGDFFYADADQDLARFPLYDPVDDDSVEFFRRRFPFDTFGVPATGNVPLRFDERFYALRRGMQGFVAAPSMEIADDLILSRTVLRQRWQTKRGFPGQERIIDWIALDVGWSAFLDDDRDNFGQQLGMLNYDFLWQVGDRLTILSDGYADLFSQGLRTVSIGGNLTQPEYGNLYLGFRSMEGPISANIASAYVNYRMSEKWIASAGSAFDFGEAGNLGQSVAFTRVGESALVQVGFNADVTRRSLGVVFSIEPRFLPLGSLGNVGGVQIPPAGARGIE